MARPTDWTALNYGADPVPGDPTVVTSAGNGYVAMADQADLAKPSHAAR